MAQVHSVLARAGAEPCAVLARRPAPPLRPFALVTGGSRGIGAAIVRRLARDGARVVFGYLDGTDAANALTREVAGSVAVRADLADPASLDAPFGPVADGLDILVNNAAINPPTPITAITPELFDQVMAGPAARWITGQNIRATGGLIL